MRALGLGLALLVAVGCDGDDTIGLVRFNNVDDTLQIRVTPTEEPGDPVERELRSNTGATVIGQGSVDPGNGPVGTEHRILVAIDDDYAETVIRVRVVATGDRGEQRHPLLRDSARPGVWQLDVRSYGEPDESRTDTFALELWRAADPGEDPDVEEERSER